MEIFMLALFFLFLGRIYSHHMFYPHCISLSYVKTLGVCPLWSHLLNAAALFIIDIANDIKCVIQQDFWIRRELTSLEVQR